MKHDRSSIPVDPAYASALGLVVYCFASLEWNAVLTCERLELGSMECLEDRTAGRVADTLVHLAKQLGETDAGLKLRRAAADFRFLAGTRNNLVYAKPGSMADGAQCLFRHGDPWTVAELEGVADVFAACSARLGAALLALRSREGNGSAGAALPIGPGA